MVEDKGTSTYNLVISQYEKNNSIYYTLRVYATCEFTLSKISEPYNPSYEKQVTGVFLTERATIIIYQYTCAYTVESRL